MKQKPDETLDSWVQQSLRQLPDTSPPGSTFDPERLWSQLRPELQATSSRRKVSIMWWATAACLASLVLGWLWSQQSAENHPTNVTRSMIRNVDTPSVSHQGKKPISEVLVEESAIADHTTSQVRLKTRHRSNVSIAVESPSSPPDESVNVVTQNSESPLPVEMPITIEKPTERNKPNVAVVAPKRRFRVMHENELRAEEETQPKLYRPDHFVRIGTGRNEEPISESYPSDLITHLTTKKTQ
ncbi:hypothetical protein [Spirosoma validum]|uniref:Uncharacterized protein n=1 Tax=Spirosoma validum TaxID=2771355 RepID=A0A927B675_9BACT|nr:hypothetical protein [Spirosoma validum]MBD2756425.1 hypothetical protein [Spirosoma validum]